MFAQDFMLRQVSIKGEVSNCKYHTSGHIYFTIKDAGAAMNAIMFAGSRAAGLSFRMKEGDQVIVTGSVEVYEKTGAYQLYAKKIELDGEGNLYLKFEQLKRELEEMGMFAAEYKQPIPQYAGRIGVVTAPTGAAVQDIRNVSSRRNPYVQVILYPALVQGEGAVSSIVKGIQTLDAMKLDVIIVGRGGGSIEDLWAFNEEITVRAVAASKIPVVSAVGHETDFTLCDFAADVRAATPSQAAELVVADVEGYKQRVVYLEQRARSLLSALLTQQQRRLDNLVNSWALRDPERLFADQSQRLDTASRRLREALELHLQQDEHKLALAAALFWCWGPDAAGLLYGSAEAGFYLQVLAPVLPQAAISWPCMTCCPTCTFTLARWLYRVCHEVPSSMLWYSTR